MVTITQGTVDLGGDTLYVQDVVLGNSTPGSLTGSVDIYSSLGSGTGTLSALSGVSISSAGITAVLTAGQVSGTGGWGIYTGSGTPTALAPRASLYINTASTLTASTVLYANTNATATGWVAVT